MWRWHSCVRAVWDGDGCAESALLNGQYPAHLRRGAQGESSSHHQWSLPKPILLPVAMHGAKQHGAEQPCTVTARSLPAVEGFSHSSGCNSSLPLSCSTAVFNTSASQHHNTHNKSQRRPVKVPTPNLRGSACASPCFGLQKYKSWWHISHSPMAPGH